VPVRQSLIGPSNYFEFTDTDDETCGARDHVDRSVRVLVANRANLMRELVISVLSDQPGVEIVGEVSNDPDIPELLVVTLETTQSQPAICETILRQHPAMPIIAVGLRENCSICYWATVKVHSAEVETSEQGLLGAVRDMQRVDQRDSSLDLN
jgi:chemotaxis response regulator CheB